MHIVYALYAYVFKGEYLSEVIDIIIIEISNNLKWEILKQQLNIR